ncbi:MAG: hypothetical protein JSR67_09045 [Proteobacteria bacterium]|nr:hypothetical protein [Pseudomonadota bacterium]
MHNRTRIILPLILGSGALLCGGALLSVAGCSRGATPAPAAAPGRYSQTATVQDLMNGVIDPSADALWDSVAFIATAAGNEERRPRTAGEWQAVRAHALTLIEGAELLGLPGRRVAVDPPGGATPGPGELGHDEIQRRIAATPGAFSQFARGLRGAARQALAAIDARDARGLMDAGGTIDEACEACHKTYWYPDQQRQ